MSQPPGLRIRPAARRDLKALTRIYNHYVTATHVTFDVTPFTVESRTPWFDQFDGSRYQCWVATAEESTGTVVPIGYASSTPFKAKPAYQTSVEVSVYLANSATGLGIGRLLYQSLFEALADEDVHRAYAGIAQPNEASMRLHAAFDFELVATFTEVGRKFDRYWDVAWLQREL